MFMTTGTSVMQGCFNSWLVVFFKSVKLVSSGRLAINSWFSRLCCLVSQLGR